MVFFRLTLSRIGCIVDALIKRDGVLRLCKLHVFKLKRITAIIPNSARIPPTGI
jgi:hypothetical protein